MAQRHAIRQQVEPASKSARVASGRSGRSTGGARSPRRERIDSTSVAPIVAASRATVLADPDDRPRPTTEAIHERDTLEALEHDPQSIIDGLPA